MRYTNRILLLLLLHARVCTVPLGIPHSTQQDAQLCGFTIPCETVVICNHQAVHLNETSWNNPCEFDPERFLDDDCEQPRLLRCISNFIPFGIGQYIQSSTLGAFHLANRNRFWIHWISHSVCKTETGSDQTLQTGYKTVTA